MFPSASSTDRHRSAPLLSAAAGSPMSLIASGAPMALRPTQCQGRAVIVQRGSVSLGRNLHRRAQPICRVSGHSGHHRQAGECRKRWSPGSARASQHHRAPPNCRMRSASRSKSSRRFRPSVDQVTTCPFKTLVQPQGTVMPRASVTRTTMLKTSSNPALSIGDAVDGKAKRQDQQQAGDDFHQGKRRSQNGSAALDSSLYPARTSRTELMRSSLETPAARKSAPKASRTKAVAVGGVVHRARLDQAGAVLRPRHPHQPMLKAVAPGWPCPARRSVRCSPSNQAFPDVPAHWRSKLPPRWPPGPGSPPAPGGTACAALSAPRVGGIGRRWNALERIG